MRPNGVAPSRTFTLFQQLPCELRLQIWQDALPDAEGSAVYFFRDWKWNPAEAPDNDDHHHHQPRPVLETDTELGEDIVNPHVPVDGLAHVCVNHEARSVALKWAARHGLAALQLHERAWDEPHDAGGRVVVRPWQPRRRGDAVYVGMDRWDDFCRRPCTFPFDGQAAVYYGTVDCGYYAWSSATSGLFARPAPHSVAIRTLALPAAAAGVAARALAGLLHCLPNLRRLQLVYGPLPQPHEREDEPLVPRRWTLADAHAMTDGVRPFYYYADDAPMGGGGGGGGGRYAPREGEAPLRGRALLEHVQQVERILLSEVKRCEVESEARDAVEGEDRLPFTLEAVVFVRGH
ncbi:hypothetical protein CCM_00291 [Cordyceps militaris CM01]|uniref:2EXR domain-containing protein n=1 Tax=Cordyceps militaris (strain CM01) TaxID=983644 RepID=G3J3A7_CORMM|nr:uncharacterized protein CCM_00291 [Cordyceps militaris CM01]EGX95637.1 hypothetical protein CCM_00291 [Cordyceps militaris CM01]